MRVRRSWTTLTGGTGSISGRTKLAYSSSYYRVAANIGLDYEWFRGDPLIHVAQIYSEGGLYRGNIGVYLYSSPKNCLPEMCITTPSPNGTFSEQDSAFVPQISVSDTDNDTLTCKYYIDTETTPRDTKNSYKYKFVAECKL